MDTVDSDLQRVYDALTEMLAVRLLSPKSHLDFLYGGEMLNTFLKLNLHNNCC